MKQQTNYAVLRQSTSRADKPFAGREPGDKGRPTHEQVVEAARPALWPARRIWRRAKRSQRLRTPLMETRAMTDPHTSSSSPTSPMRACSGLPTACSAASSAGSAPMRRHQDSGARGGGSHQPRGGCRRSDLSCPDVGRRPSRAGAPPAPSDSPRAEGTCIGREMGATLERRMTPSFSAGRSLLSTTIDPAAKVAPTDADRDHGCRVR
jgi:hypothetical protein